MLIEYQNYILFPTMGAMLIHTENLIPDFFRIPFIFECLFCLFDDVHRFKCLYERNNIDAISESFKRISDTALYIKPF
jgi:hypothetical protein